MVGGRHNKSSCIWGIALIKVAVFGGHCRDYEFIPFERNLNYVWFSEGYHVFYMDKTEVCFVNRGLQLIINGSPKFAGRSQLVSASRTCRTYIATGVKYNKSKKLFKK